MLLELDGQGPKYQQLTRALLSAIRVGDVQPGTRVTASRTLARQLGCARNVVLLAYEQLLTEGYFVSRARAGTFVSTLQPYIAPQLSDETAKHQHKRPSGLSPAGRRLVRASDVGRTTTPWPRTSAIDFVHGVTEPDARLVARMRQGVAKALRDRWMFFYGPDHAGEERLRAEIARRLHGARGIRRSAEQVVITSGAQQGLDICARLLLSPGDTVIVEDPGYEAAEAVFAAAGATIVPVPVDREGLNPALIPRRVRRARLIYLTPSHQAPTGAILTAARRHAVLTWARSRGAYVLEDDYDGELRYSGAPLKALAGIGDGDVIYCGTFAKVLFPSIRLGYLALPEALVAPVASAKWLSDRGSPTLMQRIVQELMVSGEYDRHIRRMQRRYAARRAVLTRALRHYLGSEVEVSGAEAGLHLVAWFPHLTPADVDALVLACRERDVAVYSIASYAKRRLQRGGLILGYGLVDERAIEAGVRRLAAAYRGLRTRGVSRQAAKASGSRYS